MKMSEEHPIFSVSQYTTFPLTFEQDVGLYRALGVEGIEVCEEKLSADPARAREQLAMVAASGLRVTSVQPRIHSPFPHLWTAESDPKDPAGRMERFRRTIDLFSECFPGKDIRMVAGGGIAPNYDFCSAHRIAREFFREISDYAADRGVRIGFEHLSPVLMNAFTFICAFDEAMRLVEEVDRPNFGLCLDVWHIWREAGIEERLARARDRVFAVHLADWPAHEPRGFMDRLLPGQGIIPLPALLGAIERTGYRGAYCLEVFSDRSLPDSLWNADLAQVLRQGRDGFGRAWEARGLAGKEGHGR